MYAPRFKTIFVHIPKTGGQSIEHAFLTEHGLTWEARAPLLLRGKEADEQGPKRLAHLLAREYVKFDYVAPEDFAASFKFAVVRNPYDRAVSEYRFRRATKPSLRRSFREYVLSLEYTSLERHDEPQADFVLDESGKLIVDKILRFETLAADFAEVSRQVFGRVVELPHVNKSATDVPPEAADIDLRRALHRKYERDFDLFRYASGF